MPDGQTTGEAEDGAHAGAGTGRNDMYETRDQGVNWSPSAIPGQFLGDAGGGWQVVFVDATHGWALGYQGELFRTTDGQTWKQLAVLGPVPGATPSPYS